MIQHLQALGSKYGGQGKPSQPSQPRPSRFDAISNRNCAKQVCNLNMFSKVVSLIGSRLAFSRCVYLGNAWPRQGEPPKAARARQGRSRFGSQAFPHFEKMINRISTVYDHSGHESGSFDRCGDDKITPGGSQIFRL